MPPCPSSISEAAIPSWTWPWGWPSVLLSFLGFLAAIVLGLRDGVPLHLHAITLVMGFLTGLGITVGFHRLFTHRSFETSRPVSWLLAVLGHMAGQGSLFYWVTEHRNHHRHSDKTSDPHSPVVDGFWHAHLFWFARHNYYNHDPHVIRDLIRRPDMVWIQRSMTLWYFLGLAIPAALAGLITGSWHGAMMGLLWGGFFRLFVVMQITYGINSVAHRWGRSPHATGDGSRNNLLLGVLALGEGWHNNHHAFPTSARHGLRWWQIDVSWYILWLAAKLGFVWNLRQPHVLRRGPTSIAEQ